MDQVDFGKREDQISIANRMKIYTLVESPMYSPNQNFQQNNIHEGQEC